MVRVGVLVALRYFCKAFSGVVLTFDSAVEGCQMFYHILLL